MDKKDEAKKEFAHTRGHPPRVAPRLEGKARNVGIKPQKKKRKTKKKARNSAKVVR